MDRQNNKKVSGIQAEIKEIAEKELFLFDLDGTVINSSKDISVAVNYALEKLGKDPLPQKEIIKHVGYGGKKLMEGVLGTTDEDIINKAVELFREYYFKYPAEYTTLYPYVEELFIELKNRDKKIGIVTNKYEDISRRIIEKLNIDRYLDILIGGDTVEKKKPDPEPIMYAVEKLSKSPYQTVMIGDSEADIQAGKFAGVFTVLVAYGFGKTDVAVRYNPDFIIYSLDEILTVIR
ncbi:HAD family hydrolase [Persephonella sp.]